MNSGKTHEFLVSVMDASSATSTAGSVELSTLVAGHFELPVAVFDSDISVWAGSSSGPPHTKIR